MKYNPSFLSEAELIESFVVRHADLDLIIRIIGENHTDSNQHVLVIGPRGSGKTTLVHRVAAEIKQDEEFRDRWYPLIFSEESYEVVSGGEFWLEALFHLSEQTNDEKWKQTYDELKDENDDQRLFERALAQLLDFADSQGKRILLIVENLNMLFGDLTSDDEAWKIRHTLMNESRMMLLATATNRFEEIENSSQAMFEMFKLQELKPLDDDECNRIWESVAGKKLSGERIKPIRILTGGNPRLLTIIAKFGAHRSFRKLLDDLVDLIDDHTEYFKSHLDSLPAIERKVYLALAGLWDASTAREVAKAARLDVNKTSSLLRRLKGRGAVMVEDRGKRIKWYVVAERMYNIYYLMRRRGKPADRVKATVKFMVSMYDPESAARLITEEACSLSPEVCRDHYLAFEETIKEVRSRQIIEKIISSAPKHFLESPYLSETLRNIMEIDQELVLKEEVSDIDAIKLKEANKTNKQGMKLLESGKNKQAIEKFDEVIRKFGHLDKLAFQRLVAMAFSLKGFSLRLLGSFEEAITTCDEVIARFKDVEDTLLRETVAAIMFIRGVTLEGLNRHGEAIAALDEVIARFIDEEDAVFRGMAAWAMFMKGKALGGLSCHEETIGVYEELVERFLEVEDAGIRELVARALSNKGVKLAILNRYEKAEQTFRQAIELHPDLTEVHLNLISLLVKLPERFDDAFQAAEEIIGRKPEDVHLLNNIAWQFYKHGALSLLSKAEKWSQQAVSLEPKIASAHHTLASISSALGKGSEALESAGSYIQNADFDERGIEDAIELFVKLAASGHAKEALGLLVNSPAQKHLEPLVVGLKLYMGEDVKTATEIREVAKDVVKRIEDQLKKR